MEKNMKKILSIMGAALLMVSCTEDYTDWANPFKTDPEDAKTMSMTIGAAPLIDFSSATVETIQAFVPTVAIDDEAEKSFKLVLKGESEGDEASLDADENGYVLTSVLEAAVYSLYGQRPVTREIPIEVSGYVKVGGQTFKGVGNTTLSCIPNAPDIEPAYYLTGTLNGWDNTNTDYKLTNDGSDPYENSTFTLRIPAPEDGSNIEFKMTPESGIGGDWSKCLAGGDEGKFKYNNDGGNLVIPAVEGAVYYDLVFNMMDQTWTATALLINIEPAYYLTGTLNGWDNKNTDYKMTNNGGDPYENPTFTLRIPAPEDGSNIEFKMTPESGIGGDWSKCLTAANNEGEFAYNNAGGNLVITAVEGAKFYDITFNMMDLTWNVKALTFNDYIYEAGVNNEWGAGEQPLYCANQDGIYTGFFYAQDADWSEGKGAFKFTGAFNSWNEGNYGTGTNNDDGLSGTLIDDGGSGNCLVAPGFYKAEVNLAEMTYKVTPISGIGLIGPAQAGGWDTDTDLTYNPATRAWEGTFDLTADEFKFRANDDWAINWGGSAENLTQDGANLKIATAGKYFIQFWALCETKSYAIITPAN